MSGVGDVYRNFEAGGYWGVANFFRHLGMSDKCVEEGGKWNAAVITHYQPGSRVTTQSYVGPDGYKRRASGAYFYMAVNPQGGIIVQNTLGPHAVADSVYGAGAFPYNELPWISKLSDMMWAMWEYYMPADQRPNLDFFMSLAVSNPTARQSYDVLSIPKIRSSQLHHIYFSSCLMVDSRFLIRTATWLDTIGHLEAYDPSPTGHPASCDPSPIGHTGNYYPSLIVHPGV